MRLIDQRVIRERLRDGVITWEEAASAITEQNKGRVHTSDEWKELRGRLIKGQCDQCGTSEAPFTLHHLIRPATLPDISHRLFTELWSQYKAENPVDIADHELPSVDCPACPRCGYRTIYWRKKTADWKCNRQVAGRAACGHVFNEPALVQVPDTRVRARAFDGRYAEWLVRKQEVYAEVMREAVLEWIDGFEKYMSGEDTATFCKRCAYMWDQKGLCLCPNCSTEYTPIGSRECPRCSADYKLCERCGEHRHSRRFKACYVCHKRDPITPDWSLLIAG
jgi:hypothetical protein